MIRDTAAANKSLDNDYGASKGANAPASHSLALFVGNPNLGGTELTSAGGYARISITNNGPNWPAASSGEKVGATQVFTSTGAWSGEATHWALLGSDGNWWDTGKLPSAVSVSVSGTTVSVTPVIYYATRA